MKKSPPRRPADPPENPELAQQVLGLRRAGVPWDAIADRLGIDTQLARAYLRVSLHDPELNVALEADRLDRLHTAVWTQALQGDVNAIDRVLRISERRDKVVTTVRNNTHDMRKAFDQSIAASEDVRTDGLDAGLIEAGRKIADRVDAATASGDGLEVTKALYLVPHMLNVLREALATPASRAAVVQAAQPEETEDTPRKHRLAELRSIQTERRAGA